MKFPAAARLYHIVKCITQKDLCDSGGFAWNILSGDKNIIAEI